MPPSKVSLSLHRLPRNSQLLTSITQRSTRIPNFIYISQEMQEIQGELNYVLYVKNDCHCEDFQ